MFRLLRNRRGPVDLAFRILQLEGVEDPAAVLALIAPGPREAAVRTRPLHVAVREKPLVRRAEGRDHRRLVHMALVPQGEEDFLDPGLVLRIRGVPVQVVADAELFDILLMHRVVALRNGPRGHALLVREDHRRGPVHVAAAHHEDLVPFHPVVAGDDVRGDERRDRMAQVARPRCVRPCYAHEDLHSVRSKIGA